MTTQRWTDEMLDKLASTVSETGQQIKEMQGTMKEMQGSIGELRDSVEEVRDSVDGLRVTSQALFQFVSQHQKTIEVIQEEQELMKQRQQESDQRFNTLLEEVRFLIRGIKPDDNQ